MRLTKLILLVICVVFLNQYYVFAKVKTKLLDKVIAIVNSDVILKSDLDYFRKNMSDYYIDGLGEEKAKDLIKDDKLALDVLIDDLIIRQAVKELNLQVSDIMLEKQITNLLKSQKVNKKELEKKLKKDGRTYEDFRLARKHELERFNVLKSEINPRVSLNDYELKSFYDQKIASMYGSGTSAYELVDFVSNSQNATKIKNLLLEKDGLKKAMNRCKNNCQVIDIGYVNLSDLDKKLAHALKKLGKQGRVTAPVVMRGKVHVFYVKSKKAANYPSFEEVKEKLTQQYYDVARAKEFRTWIDERRSKSFIDIK